jgi:cell wall-associated NlpC family hydrolase
MSPHRFLAPIFVAAVAALVPNVLVPNRAEASGGETLVLYDDAFRNGAHHNEWNGRNDIAATDVVKVGSHSIRTTPDAWSGIFIDLPDSMSTTSYSTLRFWVNGGTDGTSSFAVVAKQHVSEDVAAAARIPAVAPNGWLRVEIPMESLGGAAYASATERSLWFVELNGTNGAPLYLDQIELVGGPSTVPPSTTVPPSRTVPTTPVPTTTVLDATPDGCAIGFVCENFTWSGDHAATTANGVGKTVWWNPDRWDVRHDMAFDSQDSYVHTDLHKAATASATDGTEANDDSTTNGVPNTPGIAAMHVHETAIASARLRTPVVLDSRRPAIVRFSATRYVTGGHWWEVALTPDITAGEHTAVPGFYSAMAGPVVGSGASRGGPGHANPTDSINIVTSGWPDDCSNATYLGVRSTVNGVTTDAVNQVSDVAAMTKVSPEESDELYPWEMRFWPDHVEVALDADRDGSYDTVESFAVNTPWKTAYVHLMAIAYHAQVHPPAPCNRGQDREFMWRNVQVGPVVDANTAVFPREQGTDNVPRRTGWMLSDARDNQRFGKVGALPQPNPARYDNYGPVLMCSAEAMLADFYCPTRTAAAQLPVDLPSLQGVASARLVYDTMKVPVEGVAMLSVNGSAVGTLPAASTVRTAATDHWSRRSIEIPVASLREGSNAVTVTMQGDVRIDRVQIELSSAAAPTSGQRPSALADRIQPIDQPATEPVAEPAGQPDHDDVAADQVAAVVQAALDQLGKPYVFGSHGPDTFDCSGLITFAYRAAGIELPAYTLTQQKYGVEVAVDDMQPGDLIFGRGGNPIEDFGHVAMYIGVGKVVHAPRTGDVVKIANINHDNVQSIRRIVGTSGRGERRTLRSSGAVIGVAGCYGGYVWRARRRSRHTGQRGVAH